MAQITWPPSPLTTCAISRFSTKSIVFLKMFEMSLTAKKVNYIFEEPLKLNIIVY